MHVCGIFAFWSHTPLCLSELFLQQCEICFCFVCNFMNSHHLIILFWSRGGAECQGNWPNWLTSAIHLNFCIYIYTGLAMLRLNLIQVLRLNLFIKASRIFQCCRLNTCTSSLQQRPGWYIKTSVFEFTVELCIICKTVLRVASLSAYFPQNDESIRCEMWIVCVCVYHKKATYNVIKN